MNPSETSPSDQLAQEKNQLFQLEQKLDAAARLRLSYIDELCPIYMAYIDANECYRYHNRAYREWRGLEAGQIDGHSLLEVLGDVVYAEIAEPVRAVLAGKPRRYERTQKTANGGSVRYFVHLIPHFDDAGKVLGFYTMVTDDTKASAAAENLDFQIPALSMELEPAGANDERVSGETVQALYDDTLMGDLGEWKNASDRIKSAIRNDEFHLYGQPIKDVQSSEFALCEIYIRMIEEEENLMPPGAFLPLAQQYGLIPEIDRWVVTNVLKHISARRNANPSWRIIGFCVNLAQDTLRDPYFPDFVRAKLAMFDLPGEALYFEIEERDVDAAPVDAAHMVQELARLGCQSVLCGFGRDKVSFTILKELRVGLLKIDSSIILRILRDKSALTKLVAINRVAHTVGIKTIAEFVESDDIYEKLKEIGVDFAQGIGISAPVSLAQIP